jgi:hypothetical protein
MAPPMAKIGPNIDKGKMKRNVEIDGTVDPD